MKKIEYKVNKGFLNQLVDGKMTIFDGENSIIYTLNETATYIFKKIKQSQDKDQIIRGLVKKYKVDEKKASSDYAEFIKDLESKRIISK
ncbi:MAG TPA: PqqD family protein [Patescibacteria group bacterium]|nr:PqqD family protein [Patescibacteria group bacterium]